MNDDDLRHLRRCADLAAAALEAGDAPFGSVLVSADGEVLREDRNREVSSAPTHHPELMLALWGAEHLTPEERAGATVYTSGEHCAMCSAAHAYARLGRIVFAVSGEQYATWLHELGADRPPVIVQLPAREVAPFVTVEGPADELADVMRDLHARHAAGGR